MCTETTEVAPSRRVLKTSRDEPLRVDWLPLGDDARGALGLSGCPGMHAIGRDGAWRRDLSLDLRSLAAEGVGALVCLVPDDELEAIGAADLPAQASRYRIRVVRLPVRDGHAPEEHAWLAWILERLVRDLRGGQRVVLHCRDFGRSGTVAACLALRLGLQPTPEEAIGFVRRVQAAGIRTPAQERFVREYAEAYGRRFGRPSLATLPRRAPPWRLNEALALGRAQNVSRRLRFDVQDGRLPSFEELTEVLVDRHGRASRDVWEEVSADYAVTGWPREGWTPWPDDQGL